MLLSCMWTMALFGKHMEVTATRVGSSLIRCGRPIFIVGLIVTGVNFWFNETLVPYTEREAEVLKEYYTKQEYVEAQQRMLTYRSPTSAAPGCSTISIFTASERNNDQIVPPGAERIARMGHHGGPGAVRSGRRMDFHQRHLYAVQPGRADSDPGIPIPSSSLFRRSRNSYRYHEQDQGRGCASSWVIWDILQKNQNRGTCRAIYETVFWYRLAFPWSCFLAAFLGIPLATKNERSGIMLAVVMAVAIIVVYYVVSMGFLMLGKQGAMNPFIAGMLPTIGFIIFGWYNVLRGRV